MSIRFVNTTTNIPVDEKLFNTFLNTLHPDFSCAVESKIRHLDQESFDVFFVDADDVDLERQNKRDREIDSEEGGMDFVGVYISPHQGSPRPVIKVSPEKVMDLCVAFKRNSSVTLPLECLYPVFLIGVVIHELAHLIMDESSNDCGYVMSWQHVAERLDKWPDHDYFDRPRHKAGRPPPSVRGMCHFVEESLANAFVLKQRVRGKALAVLKLAMETEPEGYKHGLLWLGSLAATLDTAVSWRDFKTEIARPCWSFVFSETYPPIEKLVGHLRAEKSIVSVNIERDFYRHLASRVVYWQLAYEKNASVWEERLNGTFGVYDRLATWGHSYGINSRDRLKFMRRRAANGSADGVDELHELLSKTAVAKGRYQSALRSERKRLANAKKLKSNERLITEINASIAKIDDLIKKAGGARQAGLPQSATVAGVNDLPSAH